MTEVKFWSFTSIALAIMAFFYNDVSTGILILIGVLAVVFCFFVSIVWNKIADSNHKWIDAVFFLFAKNKLPYIVVDKIINYNVKDASEATYELMCNLISKSDSIDFRYKGRYHWEQQEDISVSVSGIGDFAYECSEDFKWSNVDIIPKNRIIHKKDKVTCGFSLNNLKINNLNRHSYLSCKMIEKAKHVKLIAKVNPSLMPVEKALYIVQNSLGDEILREPVFYNKSTESYEKTISYPRRGRKYIIKWDYEN